MTVLRKLIGFLVILVAIAALVATIWSVGTARVVVKPKFFAEVPQQVLKVVPDLVDKAFLAAKQPGAIKDTNAQAWMQAASKVSVSPNDVFQNSGLYSWLQNELSSSLDKLGAVLRGQGKSQDIVLDNRPLKKALMNPIIQKYIQDILQHLPACTPSQMSTWTEQVVAPGHNYRHDQLPACNPGSTATQIILGKIKLVAESKLKDEQVLLRSKDIPAVFVGIRIASAGLWLLFLLPLILLTIASLVGGTSPRGKFRWFGMATFLGGIFPLAISWFIKDIGLHLMTMDPTSWNLAEYSHFWTSQANQVLLEKVSLVSNQTMAPIFSSVFAVSAVVTLIGILFIVLSWAANAKTPSTSTNSSPAVR